MHDLSDEMHIRIKSGKFLQKFIYADGRETNSFLVEQIRQWAALWDMEHQ